MGLRTLLFCIIGALLVQLPFLSEKTLRWLYNRCVSKEKKGRISLNPPGVKFDNSEGDYKRYARPIKRNMLFSIIINVVIFRLLVYAQMNLSQSQRAF